MIALVGLLVVDLALLALAVAGAALARRRHANTLIYGGALALSGLGLGFALARAIWPQGALRPLALAVS